jgi:hypothetical protein
LMGNVFKQIASWFAPFGWCFDLRL